MSVLSRCASFSVEPEPEVRDWLEQLPTLGFGRAAFYIDLLADEGPLLDEPYIRQLDGPLRELRFHMLTVFHKARMREDRQVEPFRRALARCQAEAHTPDEEDADS